MSWTRDRDEPANPRFRVYLYTGCVTVECVIFEVLYKDEGYSVIGVFCYGRFLQECLARCKQFRNEENGSSVLKTPAPRASYAFRAVGGMVFRWCPCNSCPVVACARAQRPFGCAWNINCPKRPENCIPGKNSKKQVNPKVPTICGSRDSCRQSCWVVIHHVGYFYAAENKARHQL